MFPFTINQSIRLNVHLSYVVGFSRGILSYTLRSRMNFSSPTHLDLGFRTGSFGGVTFEFLGVFHSVHPDPRPRKGYRFPVPGAGDFAPPFERYEFNSISRRFASQLRRSCCSIRALARERRECPFLETTSLFEVRGTSLSIGSSLSSSSPRSWTSPASRRQGVCDVDRCAECSSCRAAEPGSCWWRCWRRCIYGKRSLGLRQQLRDTA